MPTKKQKGKSNVSQWINRESPHIRRALEAASRHFDRNDSINVHTLEAVYGEESSFGQARRSLGINGAAGDFQMDAATARRMGLSTTKRNDERFDIDASSAAAGKYLKTLDNHFRRPATLTENLRTVPIVDRNERKSFVIAAYNAGDARIAIAQQEAIMAGRDPTKWDDVNQYLEKAGASKAKAIEIRNYVDRVKRYEREFSIKSPANSRSKYEGPSYPRGAHWITISGRHILIKG